MHAERLGRERPTRAPDAGLHLVEHEQNAVGIAPLAKSLQPLDRRHD